MRSLAASFLILFAVSAVYAQTPPTVVSARTLLASNVVHAGGTAVKVAVVAHVQPGYHINAHKPSLDYLIPTEMTFDKSASLKVERVVYPQGKLTKFVFLSSPISVYEGEIWLGALLHVARSVKPGTYPLQGKLSYQACNDHACLPPTNAPLKVYVHVVPTSVPVKPENSEIFKKIRFK